MVIASPFCRSYRDAVSEVFDGRYVYNLEELTEKIAFHFYDGGDLVFFYPEFILTSSVAFRENVILGGNKSIEDSYGDVGGVDSREGLLESAVKSFYEFYNLIE